MYRKQSLLMAALALTAATASATTIYQDDFIGHADVGADGLNGETPDIGANTWIAATTFGADGSIASSAGASATLAFTPVDGLVYTLDASLRNFADTNDTTTPDNDWMALGFVSGQSTGTGNSDRFINANVIGKAWMLYRGASTADITNKAWVSNAGGTSGTGVNTDWDNLASDYAGDIDMRIVLDTTGGAGDWKATWYAKKPADGSYSIVQTETILPNESIDAVGIARGNSGFTADVTSFSLTSVPEPSSLALLGLGGLLIARRRRN